MAERAEVPILSAAELRHYSLAALPDALDDSIARVVESFREQGREAVGEVKPLGTAQHELLCRFVSRAASLAVREEDAEWLEVAVVAARLAAESPYGDWRDLGGFLHVVSDAATRLGVNRRVLFEAASRGTKGRVREVFAIYAGKGRVAHALDRWGLKLGIGFWRVRIVDGEVIYQATDL